MVDLHLFVVFVEDLTVFIDPNALRIGNLNTVVYKKSAVGEKQNSIKSLFGVHGPLPVVSPCGTDIRLYRITALYDAPYETENSSDHRGDGGIRTHAHGFEDRCSSQAELRPQQTDGGANSARQPF